MYQQSVRSHTVSQYLLGTVLVAISLLGCGKKDGAGTDSMSDSESVDHRELYASIQSVDDLKAKIKKYPSILSARVGAQHTYLHKAAIDCKADWVQALIDAGADIEVVDMQGRTPLHVAVDFSNAAPIEERFEAVKVLLDAGADPDAFSWQGTPTGMTRSDFVFGGYGIKDDRFYQLLLGAGGDPDGFPESIETVELRVGMSYEKAVAYLRAGEYEEVNYFSGLVAQADWSELDRPRLMKQEQFIKLHYGGLLYLEPTEPGIESDSPLLGRLLLWHPFFRNGSARQPVDVDKVKVSVASPKKMRSAYLAAFEVE